MGSGHLLPQLLPLGLACISLLSCGDASGDRRDLVRDSAGVVVVDHGPVDPDAEPQWSLSPDPSVKIGTVAGDEAYQFYRVQDASRLADGSILVIDQSFTLRRFDPEGTLRWRAGSEGDGPGEFRFPRLAREVRGDSLVVWDGAVNRLSIFTPGGRFARAATLQKVEGHTMAWGLAGDGTLLIEARHGERTRIDGHEAFVHPSDFYLVDLDGLIARELGRRIFATNYQEVDENGAFSPAIFSASAVIGASAAGLWYGDSEGYELREEEGPDEVRRIVRWQGPDRTVTDRDVDALLAKWGEGVGDDPVVRRFLVEYGNTHPRAERFAAYERLLVDRADRLWVQDFVRDHSDDGLRRWTIFSPDGTRIIGRMTHEAAIVPYDVGEDWLLGVERDELDVEWVALYEIIHEN